jgi:hypothetical protein
MELLDYSMVASEECDVHGISIIPNPVPYPCTSSCTEENLQERNSCPVKFLFLITLMSYPGSIFLNSQTSSINSPTLCPSVLPLNTVPIT